jgi:hypothetical protein
MIELLSCRQYKPGDSLALTPVTWNEIIDVGDDGSNGVDHHAPSGGRSPPRNGNENANGESEENTQRSQLLINIVPQPLDY